MPRAPTPLPVVRQPATSTPEAGPNREGSARNKESIVLGGAGALPPGQPGEHGCYRWLGSRLKGFEKSAPKQLDRRFVETAGTVTIHNDRLVVAFDRRSHNPILREAALDRDSVPIPWLGQRKIEFTYR